MCSLYCLEKTKIVGSFLNRSQFLLRLRWWDTQADASHAFCMSLFRWSPTIFCCYNHANSRIASIHLLKQLYGMEWAISSPHQSPAQGCKKLWTVSLEQLCHAMQRVRGWSQTILKCKIILPKDSTEPMEIKNKYPFLHQLQNWISDSSIKLMPESTRRLWNFQGFPCSSLEQKAKQLIT